MRFNGDAKGKWVDMCISESVVTCLIDTHAIVLEIGSHASSPWGQAFQLSTVRHAFVEAYLGNLASCDQSVLDPYLDRSLESSLRIQPEPTSEEVFDEMTSK